jgi:hypothetical protein
MSRRLAITTALAATVAAGALLATPVSAGNVAWGVSVAAPGLSVAVGAPVFGAPLYGAPVYVAPRPVYRYGPYRPYYRPFAPVVYPAPVVAYAPPVVVAPRVYAPGRVVVASPYARPVVVPYGIY